MLMPCLFLLFRHAAAARCFSPRCRDAYARLRGLPPSFRAAFDLPLMPLRRHCLSRRCALINDSAQRYAAAMQQARQRGANMALLAQQTARAAAR